MTFADRLSSAIRNRDSVLCAGLDPNLADLPAFVLDRAQSEATTDEEFVHRALQGFAELVMPVLARALPAVKPNLAFYEQYGVGGLMAFGSLTAIARSLGLLVIGDAKRGDIGSTAQAYANAFLGEVKVRNRSLRAFEVDALTVSPFLGFDTLEPFVQACADHGKGLYVLVKTSNPGSADLQGVRANDGETVTVRVARWVEQRGASIKGAEGISSLGAVVGATYPEEASALRALMPHAPFLIPGLGAQGGTAESSVAGFGSSIGSGLVNVSRGIFGGLAKCEDAPSLLSTIETRCTDLNQQLRTALAARAVS